VRVRPVGLIVMCAAVVILSVSSTLVKKSGAPGPTVAFWRTVGAAAIWTAILWATERRTVRVAELRKALVPGIAFGLNIAVFFTAVTHTTVANAEFIGTLTPIVLVPAGAIIFHEQINARALAFGVVGRRPGDGAVPRPGQRRGELVRQRLGVLLDDHVVHVPDHVARVAHHQVGGRDHGRGHAGRGPHDPAHRVGDG
jgi:hypothetical protein